MRSVVFRGTGSLSGLLLSACRPPGFKSELPRRGQVGLFFLVLLVAFLAGIWWFWGYSTTRYYVSCYDGEMTRYIDVPPYSKRIAPVEQELVGHAKLEIGVSPEQVNTFLSSMCARKGFIFRTSTDGFDIEISPTYIMKGKYDQTQLSLFWVPRLSEKLKKLVTPELASQSLLLHAPPEKKKR